MHHTARGLTLMELLLVMLLMGIMTSLAMPGFLAFNQQNARAAAVNQLQSTLAFARNTAITQRMYVTVCAVNNNRCDNDWNNEILIVTGDKKKAKDITPDEVIRRFAPITALDITKNGGYRIRFDALGHSEGFQSSFEVCPTNTNEGRKVIISGLGRVRIDKQPHDCST